MSIHESSRVLPYISTITKEVNDITLHVKEDAALHGLVLIIAILVTIFASTTGYTNSISFFSYMYVMKLLAPVSLLVAVFGYFFILLFRREPRPIKCYWEKIKLIYSYRAKVISSFILLTSISIFMSCFSTVKSLIPLIHPFSFDHLFHRMDLWLFGGVEPWRVIHSIITSPYILQAINFCYNLWFFLMWAMLCYFLTCFPSKLRTRFFISWILCWTVLGMIAATLLSSAGPVFMVRLEPGFENYDLLVQLLQDQNSWLKGKGWSELYSLNIQDILWEAYVDKKDMLGSGISAMPSMHVSIAVLMALVMNSANKKLGVVFGLYALVIFIGSIALGWHYAVDGIVSAPVTWLLWRVSGKVKC
ncbi:Mlr1851 protein [Vibrio maritimus]|uniref:Mlr1851 protein n=1 Tax=Vibrio maritimus TaxID=990268 RepID=A0A090S021_9VIBR|nr:Mlr1851 protein [Vibrio maritimus]